MKCVKQYFDNKDYFIPPLIIRVTNEKAEEIVNIPKPAASELFSAVPANHYIPKSVWKAKKTIAVLKGGRHGNH